MYIFNLLSVHFLYLYFFFYTCGHSQHCDLLFLILMKCFHFRSALLLPKFRGVFFVSCFFRTNLIPPSHMQYKNNNYNIHSSFPCISASCVCSYCYYWLIALACSECLTGKQTLTLFFWIHLNNYRGSAAIHSCASIQFGYLRENRDNKNRDIQIFSHGSNSQNTGSFTCCSAVSMPSQDNPDNIAGISLFEEPQERQ